MTSQTAAAVSSEPTPETKPVEIRHRWRDEVLFTAQIPTDTPSGLAMRVALEQASSIAAHVLSACRDGENGCIEWTLSTVGGRGRLTIDGKRVYAHRAVWEAVIGVIPAGLLLCHGCDNPLCVNPQHMFVGTHEQNMADMVAKGRSTKGRKQSLEHRVKVSASLRGRRLSIQTRQAISAGVRATINAKQVGIQS